MANPNFPQRKTVVNLFVPDNYLTTLEKESRAFVLKHYFIRIPYTIFSIQSLEMIPFFRKIRYRLAKDNQFLKYSRYAIGEIVLVVIGILIAIQINNWNELRKSKEIEKNVLRSLAEDIQIDKILMLEIDSMYLNDVASLKKARYIINKDIRTLEESLDLKYFGAILYDFNPRRTTYDEMINSGKIYDLSDQLLVNSIINYYEEIEGFIYETRQARSEFKAVLYGPHLVDFWLTHNFSDSKFQEHVLSFYNNTDSKEYKILKAIAHWSVDLSEDFRSKLVHLSKTNKDLLNKIDSEIKR